MHVKAVKQKSYVIIIDETRDVSVNEGGYVFPTPCGLTESGLGTEIGYRKGKPVCEGNGGNTL